ncbi:MAG: HIT domain-containing protein [Rhodanobacter sp.]
MNAVDCPFCAIASGATRASLLLDKGGVLAFMDLRQAIPGHVLVVPRRHVPDIYDLAPDEAAAIMQVAVRVARALRSRYDMPGLNLWQSNGEAGGQEVGHFHLHVHPRQDSDGLLRVYPDGLPPPAARMSLDAMANSLREHLRA